MFKNTYRGRGRGRGQRHQPYSRHQGEEDSRLPRPAPDHTLKVRTAEERTIAKEQDNLRLARDWKTYFQRYCEWERYRLPRPSDSHRVPEADALIEKIDAILQDTKTQVKETIDSHLETVIQNTEERIKNPPKPAETSLMEQMSKLVQQQQLSYEFMMKNMGRTINKVLQQREEMKKNEEMGPRQESEAKD